MELTQEQIDKINHESPYDQGIFKEPFGIPNDIKEPVVYMRWITGGMSGGSCWGDKPEHRGSEKEPKWKTLNLILQELKPNLTFLEFQEIDELVRSSEYENWGYYGNYTDYTIKFIVLSELITLLNSFE